MASRVLYLAAGTAAADGARHWFTAAELADLALPGLPADKRAINRRARDERWHLRSGADGNPLVRPRAGRGGGVEFHVSLLPGAARIALEQRQPAAMPAPAQEAISGGWGWYEQQSATTRAEAERRLAICREIDLLEQAGVTRTAAIADVAARQALSPATLWTWLGLIKGVPLRDWLPALASRRSGGGREAEIDPALWTIFKSDYLRASQPTLTSCYERTLAIAAERGLSLPSEKTLRRRLEAEVDPRIILFRRKGEEALRRSVPAQRRTVDHLHAMECVNIDGHKFDVFVYPPNPDRRNDVKPIRPMMVALQDIRSSKIVAWRLGDSESTTLARLAIADMIRDVGIPKRLTTDNGRAFASKFFTGGTTTRFRGKILETDPTGLLVALGIDIDWALPYRGQSKPIERAFRDLCDTISRAPECEGAYTGPNPQQKPENYGSRAMAWDDFHAHVAQGIARHNARLGRTGRDYRGRSFDQVFADTFVEIAKASPEQLRMALLAAQQMRVDRQTGEIKLFGNRYWAEGCGRLHGQLLTVRFDPDNLHSEIHAYGQDGRFLLTMPVVADTGWGDAEGARASAKRWKGVRRQIRDAVAAEQLLTAEQVAASQARVVVPEIQVPDVIRVVRNKGNTAAALKEAWDADPVLPSHENNVLNLFGRLRPDD
ncbi:MAG: Mu transposase C-terminal domain-containing protein [Sphingomonas sp.]|uniref:transposase domain-containing protein n=1 Tax=Sphingomonas sp. TaxID=28214 RepID=UPI0035A95E7D|nr:Mu transposase C-terminal domain-containing protein [Sphingomonas sp.]